MRRILALLACLCLTALPLGRANAEVAEWAAAQAAAEHQMEWAALFGADVDSSVQAKDITKKCGIKVSEGEKGKLTNGKVGSPWRYDHSDAWIGVQLPDDETPGAIRIEWMFDPEGYELIEYDAGQNVLRTRTQADTFPNICTVFPLLPEARMLRLKMTAKGQSVGRIALYSEGVLPADVQTWLPPQEKVDMMVFSTHQDDELIFLGGTIPYSDVVCGRPTITVYMTNCSRERRREALEGLWEMGCRHYPEFINMEDDKVSSIEKGVRLWGGSENILKEIVERIRRFKPEVIVTQDLDGEYGHNQHKIMARAMQPAIEAAADPARFPESCEKYGAWQVKKLYLHLYKENQLRMDWVSPQPAYGGESLLEVARRGFEKHASQTKYYKIKDGGDYDNALFGLALTTVGEDIAKDSFFENIPLNASAEHLAGEAAEAPEPEPEPESKTDQGLEIETEATVEPEATGEPPAFEPAPTEAPAVEAPPETVPETGGHLGLTVGLAAAGLLAVGGGAYLLSRRSRKPKKRHGKKRRKASGRSPAKKASGAPKHAQNVKK